MKPENFGKCSMTPMTCPLIKWRHGLFETFYGMGGGQTFLHFCRIDFFFSQLTEYDNHGWTFSTKKKRSERIVFCVCLHFNILISK